MDVTASTGRMPAAASFVDSTASSTSTCLCAPAHGGAAMGQLSQSDSDLMIAGQKRMMSAHARQQQRSQDL